MGVVVDTAVFILWERRGKSAEKRLLELDRILDIELAVARIHAELAARLKQKGTPIGYHDLWIAATALRYGYAVMTTNVSEFSRIADLELIHFDTIS